MNEQIDFKFAEVIRMLGRPVAYYPSMAHALGDQKCALFLSNFYYWEGKQSNEEGWIYKSQAEILRETGLTRTMQETARKKLVKIGIMTEQKKGNPGTMHYKFDWDKFNSILYKYYSEQDNKSERTETTTLYEMKLAFDEAYKKHTEIAYAWSTDKREAGKDWGPLKKLRDILVNRIKDRNNSQLQPSKEEIANNFKMFLIRLPQYHRERNFTPALLLSNFNKIILDIKSEQIPTKSTRTDRAGEYV